MAPGRLWSLQENQSSDASKRSEDMPSDHFEKPGGTHAATHAHGDDNVLHSATPPLKQGMPDESRSAHSVRMSDRDPAAIDVVDLRVDAEFVAAIECLDGESLVELPQSDVGDSQAMQLQKVRNGEHRPDTHFFRRAARDCDSEIAPDWLQVPARGELLGSHDAG